MAKVQVAFDCSMSGNNDTGNNRELTCSELDRRKDSFQVPVTWYYAAGHELKEFAFGFPYHLVEGLKCS